MDAQTPTFHVWGRSLSRKVTLRELHSEDAYEAELANCAGVTGYHRWFFLSALADSMGFHKHMFAVEKDGSRMGVLPILLRRRGPITTANDVPVSHVGPLFRDGTTMAEVITAAEPFLLRHLAVATKWAFAPDAPVTPSPLSDLGFRVRSIENFVVPGDRTIQEQLTAMSRTHRKKLMTCRALGMKASSADVDEIKDWFAGQVGAPFKKLQIVPDYSSAAAANLVQLLGADPRMLWRSVHDNHGRLAAVTASIIDTDRLYAWIITGDHDRNPSPHIFAYWDIIEWALDHGLTCDFAGAPTDGLRTYKLRLGAVSESCLLAERVRPQAYRKLRSLHARIILSGTKPSSP
jgi:hypothetical protein